MDTYYHWKVSDLFGYYFMVFRMSMSVGAENLRVELHPKASGCKDPELDGRPVKRLVNALTGEVCGEWNSVWVCPPICP